VASTPIDLTEVPALIGVLAEALGDSLKTPELGSADTTSSPSMWSKFLNRFRPTLARVIELPAPGSISKSDESSGGSRAPD
jgi:hypothetical protein